MVTAAAEAAGSGLDQPTINASGLSFKLRRRDSMTGLFMELSLPKFNTVEQLILTFTGIGIRHLVRIEYVKKRFLRFLFFSRCLRFLTFFIFPTLFINEKMLHKCAPEDDCDSETDAD